MKIIEPYVELLWITPNAEEQIEFAGRICYKSESKITKDSHKNFINRIIKSGHHSVIEHASASFKIITDRGIANEIVRHRICSFSQESSRYCLYTSDRFDGECSFIAPPNLNKSQYEQWKFACEMAECYYKQMIENGCSAEIARSVLPLCTKTELVMTANFREWRHFINLRWSKAAHPQIRPIAWMIWDRLLNHAPNVFRKLIPSDA
ncbi:MAG: FAD-dependent thymidylate synthase [Candidatus Heimdallarchaeaceae archaeon]